MKQKTTTGNYLTFSRVTLTRGRLFTPWPDNARFFSGFKSYPCASGRQIAYCQFTLDDEQSYIYPMHFSHDPDYWSNHVNELRAYRSANGVMGAVGEWYNGAQRATTFDKVKESDFEAWRLAH